MVADPINLETMVADPINFDPINLTPLTTNSYYKNLSSAHLISTTIPLCIQKLEMKLSQSTLMRNISSHYLNYPGKASPVSKWGTFQKINKNTTVSVGIFIAQR